jgi:hypothetical protein
MGAFGKKTFLTQRRKVPEDANGTNKRGLETWRHRAAFGETPNAATETVALPFSKAIENQSFGDFSTDEEIS